MYYLIKVFVTAVLIAAISELSKRNTLVGAILASIPLVSILAMIWLYIDTRDLERISTLSTSVFWLVLPSLAFFIALPLLLKSGLGFFLSMAASAGVTVTCYFIMLAVLNHFGIRL